MEDEDGFRVVSRKKGGKKRSLLRSNKGEQCNDSLSMKNDIDIDLPLLKDKIKQCVNDLHVSDFYSQFKENCQITLGIFRNSASTRFPVAEGPDTSEDVKGQILQNNSQSESTSVSSAKSSMVKVHSRKEFHENLITAKGDVKSESHASVGKLNSPAHDASHVTDIEKDANESALFSRMGEPSEILESAMSGIKSGDPSEIVAGSGSGSGLRVVDYGRVKQIVCYGLGNFSSCVTARFQLALLILLNSLLSPKDCHLFDPNFTNVEKQVLVDLGYSIISENEEGKRQSSEPTLFFMPHCGKPLYNNLLWANWGQRLSHLIILGNSFNNFAERFTSKQLTEEVPYIYKIIPYHSEVLVRNTFQYTDIFNDMAFHVFPADILQRAPSNQWADNPEPSYDHMSNMEIITAKNTR